MCDANYTSTLYKHFAFQIMLKYSVLRFPHLYLNEYSKLEWLHDDEDTLLSYYTEHEQPMYQAFIFPRYPRFNGHCSKKYLDWHSQNYEVAVENILHQKKFQYALQNQYYIIQKLTVYRHIYSDTRKVTDDFFDWTLQSNVYDINNVKINEDEIQGMIHNDYLSWSFLHQILNGNYESDYLRLHTHCILLMSLVSFSP